jgi:hypothetical protein
MLLDYSEKMPHETSEVAVLAVHNEELSTLSARTNSAAGFIHRKPVRYAYQRTQKVHTSYGDNMVIKL